MGKKPQGEKKKKKSATERKLKKRHETAVSTQLSGKKKLVTCG